MPARQPQRATVPTDANSPIGIDEAKLWSMADALHGSMDAAIPRNLDALRFPPVEGTR